MIRISGLSCLVLVAVNAIPLIGQAPTSHGDPMEVVVLTRPPILAGAQAEFEAGRCFTPWATVRYGIHASACAGACPSGWSALGGLRLRLASWGDVEPYLTVGAGELRQAGRRRITGTAHVGPAWLKFEDVHFRGEVGFEDHLSFPWLNVGVGLVP